jgi:hypothetical protein
MKKNTVSISVLFLVALFALAPMVASGQIAIHPADTEVRVTGFTAVSFGPLRTLEDEEGNKITFADGSLTHPGKKTQKIKALFGDESAMKQKKRIESDLKDFQKNPKKIYLIKNEIGYVVCLEQEGPNDKAILVIFVKN